jgi:N-acetylglutamate synthase
VKPLDPASIPAALRDPSVIGARVEQAALRATEPAQQLAYDGWLLRHAPGKAKRARSINALVAGVLALEDKIAWCDSFYRQHSLPCLYRITPFAQPAKLDSVLAAAGYVALQDTRVMVSDIGASAAIDASLQTLDPRAFGEVFGALHGLPAAQTAVEADRFARVPAPAHFVALSKGGAPIACGSVAVDGDLAGVFGMVTAPAARGRGAARRIVAALLSWARGAGAAKAYLQVEADNTAARRVYAKFGFVDAYTYWYRQGEGVRRMQ